MSARDRFLNSVQAALRGAEDAPMPEAGTADVPPPGTDDVLELFRIRSTGNGAVVHLFETDADAANWLASAVLGSRWIASAELSGSALLPPGDRGPVTPEAAESADFGIDMAVAAVADNGTIILRISSRESRSVSLLPGEHIALLRRRTVYASLAHAVRAGVFKEHDAGTHVLVGGPSRTADIEKVLVTGVHGPRALTIAVLP